MTHMSKELESLLTSSGWYIPLINIFKSEEYQELRESLLNRINSSIVYPKPINIFKSLADTKFNEVKVVLVGDEPYCGANQANGLAFSVNNDISAPPLLRQLLREVESDLNTTLPKNIHNLSGWTKQGVLLLNRVLTVEHGKPNSHEDLGWQYVTNGIIESLVKSNNNIIFILLTEKSLEIAKLLPRNGVYCLKGLSGFNNFSKANQILASINKLPISWSNLDNNPQTEINRMLLAMGLLR